MIAYSIILVLGKQRQEGHLKFEANPAYVASSKPTTYGRVYLKTKQNDITTCEIHKSLSAQWLVPPLVSGRQTASMGNYTARRELMMAGET